MFELSRETNGPERLAARLFAAAMALCIVLVLIVITDIVLHGPAGAVTEGGFAISAGAGAMGFATLARRRLEDPASHAGGRTPFVILGVIAIAIPTIAIGISIWLTFLTRF